MEPKNLQALIWFAMKSEWTRNGWTTSQGAGGSFERSFDRDPLTLIEAEIDSGEIEPSGENVAPITKFLRENPGVVSISYDENSRDDRRTITIQATVRVNEFDTNEFAKLVGDQFRQHGSQMPVTVYQTLPYGRQRTPNARPGYVVRFPKPMSTAEATALAQRLENQHPQWKVFVDNDKRVSSDGTRLENPSIGMRVIYMPENDEAVKINMLRGEDESTTDNDIMKRRMRSFLRTLKAMHRQGVIANTTRAIAVEAIQYGKAGTVNDEQGLAAFTDYRRNVDSRSVSGVVADVNGLSGRLDTGTVGDRDADGSDPVNTNGIDPGDVPTEIVTMHSAAVDRTFANDGTLDDIEVEDSPASEDSIIGSARIVPSEPAPIEYEDGADVPLPKDMETAETPGGLLGPLRRHFGGKGKIPVVSNKKKNDLGMLRRWLLPLITNAWASNIKGVRYVAEELVATDLERMRVTEGVMAKGQDLYARLPKKYRKNNGEAFYRLMDRYYDPNRPNSDAQWVDENGERLEDEVIDVLREFKKIGEEQRQGIIEAKRDTAREVASFMGVKRLVQVAQENGANWRAERVSYGPRKRDSVLMIVDEDTGEYMYVEDAREAIVMIMVPDSWGRQFSHIYHPFFGSYEGFWYSKKAYQEAIAEGKSDKEARKLAKRSISMDGGTATENTEAAMTKRLLEFRRNPPPGIDKNDIGRIEIVVQSHVPPDVVRVSGKQYELLRRDIAEAAKIESSEASAILRGKIARTEGKKRFYASVLRRNGKEGFNMDFMRAWQAQTSGYYKWLYFNRLRRNVTSTIEDLRRNGYVGWAAHLQDTLDYTTTFRQSAFEQAMDGIIARIPILRTYVGPMPTRRWLQMVRTVNVIRQLWTVRQQFVNSLQPFSTVMPILGTRTFIKYVGRYNSREGKEILARFGYLRPNGEWYEGKDFRILAGSGWFSKSFGAIKKVFEKTKLTGSESRNHNFTFVAFYLYAKERFGMSDEDAARHALLRVAQTQFAFTKANNANIFRGPTRSTLLQYKRFMTSSLGLVHNMVTASNPVTGEYLGRKERTMMLARWFTTFTVMGGIKGLPAYFILDFLAKILFQDDEATGYDIYQELREQLGENAANIVVMGLPAAAGVDISGSIVLMPKPYGRTAYDMLGAFIAGPTLSAVGDIIGSLGNKDAVYQDNFTEFVQGVYSSSPAAQQVGTLIDLMADEANKYDTQGRLQFKRTAAEMVRSTFGFRNVRESLESLEYNKVMAMKEAQDGIFDEIATLVASNKIVEAQKMIIRWNSMFPEAPLPLSVNRLMKTQDISKRVKRKIDDRTLDTRQRRLKVVNERLARILVEREGFASEEVE